MTDNNERISFTFPVLEHDEETGETVPTEDTIEVEFTRDQLQPGNVITHAETGEEPMLSNPDKTVTYLHSVVPDPRNGDPMTLERGISERARRIDPETFVSDWSYGSVMDPYGLGYGGEDNSGRVWWVWTPTDEEPAVTAWDFLQAHPEVTWEDIYARKDHDD